MTNLLNHCEVIKLHFIKITSKSVKLADYSGTHLNTSSVAKIIKIRNKKKKNSQEWKIVENIKIKNGRIRMRSKISVKTNTC